MIALTDINSLLILSISMREVVQEPLTRIRSSKRFRRISVCERTRQRTGPIHPEPRNGLHLLLQVDHRKQRIHVALPWFQNEDGGLVNKQKFSYRWKRVDIILIPYPGDRHHVIRELGLVLTHRKLPSSFIDVGLFITIWSDRKTAVFMKCVKRNGSWEEGVDNKAYIVRLVTT